MRAAYLVRVVVAAAMLAGASGVSQAQVGKSQGLLDLNTAGEKELLGLPHMSDKIARSVIDARPFADAVQMNKHLTNQGLTKEQAAELYGKAFVHINLNTASRDEIMLIPGAGRKMAHEFDEYRPWKSWAQFSKEIGKYVGEKEVARLAQYCFIPMDANKAGDEDLQTIPALGKPALDALRSGKPWKDAAALKAALEKAVSEKEAGRIVRYLVVEAEKQGG